MTSLAAASEKARLDAHTQRTNKSVPQCHFETAERNKRKMLVRTARAAPRVLRTAHRHKASSVAALRHRDDAQPLASSARRTASSVAALHDDDEAQRTIAKVVSRYARTQEQLVPWFLEQMPRSYFALVPESSQLAHLQAAAGLFDPARGLISA